MTEHNVLVTGAPRSGTTLACHLLNKLPDTVALHEPMRIRDLARLSRSEEICLEVRRFCAEQRESIATRGRAISKNVAGMVPDNPYGTRHSHEGLRLSETSKSEILIDSELSPEFVLVIKHTSAFVAVLGELVDCFPVYAIVRNPLATIASWITVDFNVRIGRAQGAERRSPELKAALASLDDALDRQIFLLGWFHTQIRRFLPDDAIIRYESIVESNGRAVRVIRQEARHLNEPLDTLNTNKLYDHRTMLRIGERLLDSDGGHWEFYRPENVKDIMNLIEKELADAPPDCQV